MARILETAMFHLKRKKKKRELQGRAQFVFPSLTLDIYAMFVFVPQHSMN